MVMCRIIYIMIKRELYNVVCDLSICTLDFHTLIISIKMDESMMIQKALFEAYHVAISESANRPQ